MQNGWHSARSSQATELIQTIPYLIGGQWASGLEIPCKCNWYSGFPFRLPQQHSHCLPSVWNHSYFKYQSVKGQSFVLAHLPDSLTTLSAHLFFSCPRPSFPVYSAFVQGLKSADAIKTDFSFALCAKRSSVTISTVFRRASGRYRWSYWVMVNLWIRLAFQEQYFNSTALKSVMKHQWFCSRVPI